MYFIDHLQKKGKFKWAFKYFYTNRAIYKAFYSVKHIFFISSMGKLDWVPCHYHENWVRRLQTKQTVKFYFDRKKIKCF